MQLRPYQSQAVDAVFEAWVEHDSTLLVSPTGCGKTVTFCEIIKRVQPQRAIVLAHRSELITQAVRRLWDFGIEASVEMADQYANETDWERSPVVVSTVQTQNAGRKPRMKHFSPFDFGLVVADEAHHYCFPYQTKILTSEGWLPIGQIVEERKQLRVYTVDLYNDVEGWKPIKSWFRNPQSQLVKVTHEQGYFYCTASHKIWTQDGYTKAESLKPGTRLRVVRRVVHANEISLAREKVLLQDLPIKSHNRQYEFSRVGLGEESEARSGKDLRMVSDLIHSQNKDRAFLLAQLRGVLVEQTAKGARDANEQRAPNESRGYGAQASRHQRAYAPQQSDEERSDQRKDAPFVERADFSFSWREWLTDKASDTFSGHSSLAYRISDLYGRCERPFPISPDLLQSRFSEPGFENCSRDRWSQPYIEEVEVSRQTENRSAYGSRVVSVEVFQQGSLGESESSNKENPFLYDIEVEDTHNYFADGVLVSNCAPSFRKVLDYYRQNPSLKILGVTATPDRADEEALGQVFQSVAFDYEILDAINDGWLVPVEQQMVNIEGLDFSQVRTTAGDLNGADLAAVMEAEKNLQGIAGASIEIIGNRQTLAFTVSVKQAERLAEIFNRHRPGMADWVCGATPKDKRHKILQDFSQRKIQVLCNVGVLTEGYDEAGVEVIVQARPTKSRCLYAQIIGRALRPLENLVDVWESSEDRKIAIAESPKPSALILDFVGNSGRHKLMTTADILGGKVSEAAIEKAINKAKREGRPVDMAKELEAAEAELRREEEERRQREAARRARVVAKAQFSVQTISPFDVFHLMPARERGWDKGKTLSEKQRSLLLKQGIDPTGMPFVQAKQIIDHQFYRWKNNLCSIKQARCLQKAGYTDAQTYTREQASALISQLAQNGWKPVQPVIQLVPKEAPKIVELNVPQRGREVDERNLPF